jgi:superoxide oxidase
MSDNNSQIKKFNPALISLHWLMLLLIIGSYVSMELSDSYPDGSPEQFALKGYHFSLGISILLLVVVRVIVRLLTKVPPIIPTPDAKQALLAKLMHLALYAFMFGMPILGWLMVNTHGYPVSFWGLAQIPTLMGEDKALNHFFHEAHEIGGNLGYFLIGLHAAAGLFHHYKLKDNTLLRMSFLKK